MVLWLYLEDVGFFGGQVLLKFADELVERFLNAVLFISALIFREVALFLLLFDLVDRVAAQVAQGHLALFCVLRRQLAELLAALLGEGRHVDADDLAVVVGGEAQLTHGDRLFDRSESTDVERLNLDRLRIRGRQGGQRLQRCFGAVVLNADSIQQGGIGPAGANGVEVALGGLHRLAHAGFEVLGRHGC